MASPGEVLSVEEIEAKTRKTRLTLFALLLIVCTIPLLPFVAPYITVPNKPTAATIDLYTTLMDVPNGSTVLVQTDWTNSTRGESGGQFEALLRILMRKDCKIAYYSNGDPQAPEVARNVILGINDERKLKGERQYEQWKDYVSIGFFPNAEGANNAMAANLRSAWSSKKDVTDTGDYAPVFQSPVLQKVRTINDVPLIAIVTASSTFNFLIERLSGKGVPVVGMVTGVMGPESAVYYASRQVNGLAAGMKGVYDLETMMEYGIETPDAAGKIQVMWPGHKPVPGFPGEVNFSKGKLYYPTLHAALTLLIIAVIVGNVGMYRARRRAG